MIAVAVSDLHGFLPKLPEQGFDTLIVAGDVSPLWGERDRDQMLGWLDTNFRKWLMDAHEQGHKNIIGISGNHDFILQQHHREVERLELPWTYLLDSSVEIDGCKFYGLPWVANLRSWAFYAPEGGLREKFGQIPEDTDVIVAHTPPTGYGDDGHPEWVSLACNDAIKRVRPEAYVCGHIHGGYGIYQVPDSPTTVYNVSLVDDLYIPQDRFTKVVAL